MARGRKGEPLSGWLIVDKPAGPTSSDVVNKVKWAFQAQKAGHAGTLDPAATGLLAVALGEATKTIPYIMDALKAYQFEVRLGAETTTDDADGVVVKTSDLRPLNSQIEAALAAFRGQIAQVPPQFSAVKVDGQRAYDLAREGERLDLSARPLWVESLRFAARADQDRVQLDMVCGKGGYVRSIARDLGRALGCLGHVAWLRRVASGPFDIAGAVTLADIEARARTPEILGLLRPVEVALVGLPGCAVSPQAALRVRMGNSVPMDQGDLDHGALVWASLGGQCLAIGHLAGGQFHPSRVLLHAVLDQRLSHDHDHQ